MFLYTAVALVLTLVCSLVFWVIRRLRRDRQPRTWRRRLVSGTLLLLISFFIGTPLAFGLFITYAVGTRPDERNYAGPVLDSSLVWMPTLPMSGRTSSSEPSEEPLPFFVRIPSISGGKLRAFFVPRPSPSTTGPLTAICTHGLFRSAMEVDRIGAEFHKLGLSVLLLEWRGHGGSDRAPFTGGKDIHEDILSAVAFVKAQPQHTQDEFVLFGISLGTAGVLRAAIEIEGLRGVAVEAPLADLKSTTMGLLRKKPEGEGALVLPGPLLQLVLFAWERVAGFRIDEVETVSAVRTLSPTTRVLFVGAGEDRRMPPESVRALFAELPQPESHRRLWIQDDARHGRVFESDAPQYREHLRWLISP
ncbi:MAG TPA: alpha/beta fold hydrolase [Planctomycetota bacterium]|nr:alpha/beta fold hydrolase [Planctomycetota bacterium]